MTDDNSTPTPVLTAAAARLLEIVRECLAGDPFRTVPQLESETNRLAPQIAGEDAQDSGEDEELGHLPAYLVADNALGLFAELARSVRSTLPLALLVSAPIPAMH